MVKECVNAIPTLPLKGRIHSQAHEKTLTEETTTASNSGRTFTHKIVKGVNINIL
jgi:hypothetical protein